MIVRLAAVACLLFAAHATARTVEPVINFENVPIRAGHTAEQVRDTIVSTAATMPNPPWTVMEAAPGRLLGHLNVRGRHRAVVEITYSPQAFSITLVSASKLNHNASDGTINPNYNVWVRQLMANLELALNAADAPARPAADAESRADAAVPASRAASATSVEVTFWESVRNTKEPAELRAYLDQYPNGSFAPLAKARLAALDAPLATAPTAASITPGLPQPGDSWTYRLSYPRIRGEFGQLPGLRVPRVLVAKVLSASNSEIVDQLSVDGKALPAARHGREAYLHEQGVSVFSPYLAAFDGLSPGTGLGTVAILDAACGTQYFCEAKARIVGNETVSVPAGKFPAIRITVEESWQASGGSGDTRQAALLTGGRTLTVWYVPELKRAVKFASRRTFGSYPPIEPSFDVELVSYQLK